MENTHMSEHMLSSEKVANNVDLLAMILIRVPTTYLLRFKCVSKNWLSLISDSKFCNDHTRKNLDLLISGLYFYSRPLVNLQTNLQEGKKILPKLDFLDTPSGVKATISDSCNGLMLCSRGTEIILCNLATQKFKVVPSLSDHSTTSIGDKFLYFDPARSPYYKIVTVNITCTSLDSIGIFSSLYSYDIKIFSSESEVWKKLHFSKPRLDPFSHKVLCDGAIYWIADQNNLVRFDINVEHLATIQMPPEIDISGNICSVSWFGEYNGKLFLVLRTVGKFQVLEMDMHHYSWTIKYNFDHGLIINTTVINNTNNIRGIFGMRYSYKPSVNVLYFMGGDEETHTLLFAVDEKIISYNLRSNYRGIIQDLPRDISETITLSAGPIRAHKFIASLAMI